MHLRWKYMGARKRIDDFHACVGGAIKLVRECETTGGLVLWPMSLLGPGSAGPSKPTRPGRSKELAVKSLLTANFMPLK